MRDNDELDIILLGDTYFGEWHMLLRAKKGKNNVLEEYGYCHFAQQLNPLLQSADTVIANLECAITDIPTSPFAEQKVHTYAAKEQETIEALKASNISIVCLANNHACDFGKAGLVDTFAALERHGIRYVGGGRNQVEASRPVVVKYDFPDVAFEIAVVSCYNYNPASDRYGFYADECRPGVNRQTLKIIREQADAFKKQSKSSLFVLVPHWGPNYAWRTWQQRRQATELMATDVGLIVGHSAHMMQEVEYVNGKLVVYSVGNFILNGDGEYRARNLPPYSFIARLNVASSTGTARKRMVLYPFVCDNLGTDFTPRFVTDQEFSHVLSILRALNFDTRAFDETFRAGKDGYGYYLEYAVD